MKNARRHFLINFSFQLRFALFITFAIFAMSMVFPLFLLKMFDTAGNHALIMNNPPAQIALKDAKKEFLILLVGVQGLMTAIAFGMALLYSHRIAGPLYKLKTAMTALRQGILDRHIFFRDKDTFPELAEEFNSMSDAIFARRRKDFEYLHSIIPKLERLKSNLAGEDQSSAIEVLNVVQELVRESQPKK
jgi:sensor histidine kinase YesM